MKDVFFLHQNITLQSYRLFIFRYLDLDKSMHRNALSNRDERLKTGNM